MRSEDVVDASNSVKVVIHYKSGAVHGYLPAQSLDSIEDSFEATPNGCPNVIRFRRVGADVSEDLDLAAAKALYYVSSFEGNVDHEDLKFSINAPLMHAIWLRVEFKDGESLEGTVHNTMDFLVKEGFFLHPSDPESNNLLVYVFKRQLQNCTILGLRRTYEAGLANRLSEAVFS